MKKLIPLAFIGITATAMTANAEKLNYPTAPTEAVIDEYFGMKVADPYRPLENDTAAVTLQWAAEENALTDSYLNRIPFRQGIKERLTELSNYPKFGLPAKEKDGYYYIYRNDGLQNQSVLYRTKDLNGGEEEVFIDPNTLSADGTVALTGVFFSKDGKYAAYTISRNGSDWTEIYVMDTKTKQLLPDHIEWAKFTGARWRGDGFYYNAYDKPAEGKEFSNTNENHKVYFHKIGTSQDEDELVYEDLAHPLFFHSTGLSDDGRYLFLIKSGAGSGNALSVKDLADEGSDWVTIFDEQTDEISPLDVIDGKLYIYTTKDAPKGRVVVTDVTNPTPENWVDLIPETDAVLAGINFAGDNLIIVYNQDVSHHSYLYNLKGEKIREIDHPAYGTVAFSADRDHNEVFYRYASFTSPGIFFSYDMDSGKSTQYATTAPEGFNPDDYVTEQVFYTSEDGTRVPMYLVYKKGLKKDSNNPVYLYGYGGFNIPLNPGFSSMRLFWLENGGIYAQANLRGGSEYGEEWHQAGTKQDKLNVFNDFIGAAEYLINEGWTNPDKLSIAGGSNGGLLVGAVTNMRPELFKVAIPMVGVMDMMRYHLFTIGWNWAADYGTSADSPEMAKYLLDYSPIHNIRNDGTRYPAVLITTADHDDRVVPAHSFKYAATLQAADTGDLPKLIRIESNAGHGGGKPMSKSIEEYGDIYSFILYNMGLEPKKSSEKK